MLFDKTYQNFYSPEPAVPPAEAPDEEQSSNVVFEEQQVTTTKGSGDLSGYGTINFDGKVAPAKLTFTFEGQEYTISKTQEDSSNAYYGEKGDSFFVFDKYPFAVTWYERFNESQDGLTTPTYIWVLHTPDAGTYTIGAKIPEDKPEPTPEPKRKGRSSIISQLTRLVKALGGNARKSSLTIASQLSVLADLAEAGGIGGGGIFPVTVRATIEKGSEVPVFEKASATSGEIMAAFQENKCPILFLSMASAGTLTHSIMFPEVLSSESASFNAINSALGLIVKYDGTVDIQA